jgi:hypothetical protein
VASIDAKIGRGMFTDGALVLQAGKKKHRRIVLT